MTRAWEGVEERKSVSLGDQHLALVEAQIVEA